MPKVRALVTYKIKYGEGDTPEDAVDSINFFYSDEEDKVAEIVEVDEATFLALIKFAEESGKELHIPEEQ